MKKMHKRGRQKNFWGEWIVGPLCFVQHLTFAYNASTDWREVTCQKCLAKRPAAKPEEK